MDIREIRTFCSRAKVYAQKGEALRAVGTLISGLKGTQKLATATPADVRTLIRETVQALATDERVKTGLGGLFRYEPGQEKALLVQCQELEKILDAQQNYEAYEVAKARKLKLDQQLNRALARLEQKQPAEADTLFSEALEAYRDEHRVFAYIAKALIDAGAPGRAVKYIKRGLTVLPQDALLQELMNCAESMRTEEVDNA